MNWYQRLNQYFPDEELKKKEQLEALVKQNPHYKVIDGEQFLVLYGEYDEFIFVDYVLVDERARGQGIGSSILDSLKSKQTTVILEVEPVDLDHPDTVKRERFYRRNQFKKANIEYYRDVGELFPELNPMDIYYWSPDKRITEKDIRDYLIIVY